MLLNKKIDNKNIFFGIILIYYFFYILSVIIVDGYPQTNDILHIFKIAPLDGNLKFLIGIYGPGYTYYSLIFSNSLNVLSFFIVSLNLLSCVLIFVLVKEFYKINSVKEGNLYFLTLLFHLIILTTIGFNHSDSIFILLFYNGLLTFVYGHYLRKKNYFILFGLLLIGIAAIFRHQGPFAILLLFINFLLIEHLVNKKFILFSKKYFLYGIILSLPTILAHIHLYTVDAIVNWQTSFKLHYFFHGETWGDWRDLKYVLVSEDVKNFSITQVDINHAIKIIYNHLHGILRIVYPFIFCFLIAFYLSKKKVIIYSLILFLIYILITLAGYHRGYYPSIFFCFISVILCFKEIYKNKIFSTLIFIFLFGHFIYVSDNYVRDVIERYKINQDIKKNVVPILNKEKISYKNIFSDDYNFYTTRLNGKMHNMCNWGGWLLNHPYLYDYYPREVVLKKDNKYCDVKVLITRDKKLVQEYENKEQYKTIYKTDFYYLLM